MPKAMLFTNSVQQVQDGQELVAHQVRWPSPCRSHRSCLPQYSAVIHFFPLGCCDLVNHQLKLTPLAVWGGSSNTLFRFQIKASLHRKWTQKLLLDHGQKGAIALDAALLSFSTTHVENLDYNGPTSVCQNTNSWLCFPIWVVPKVCQLHTQSGLLLDIDVKPHAIQPSWYRNICSILPLWLCMVSKTQRARPWWQLI